MQVILFIVMLAFLLEGGIVGLLLGIPTFLLGAWAIDYISASRYRWRMKSHIPPHPGVVEVSPQQKETPVTTNLNSVLIFHVVEVSPQQKETPEKDPLEGGGSSVNNDGTF